MKKLSFNLEEIKERRITFTLENEFEIEFLYNFYDEYIYLAILNKGGEVLLGHSRLVQDINYFSLARITTSKQLRCIKTNEFAEETDYITSENLNRDYQFFLIDEEELSV